MNQNFRDIFTTIVPQGNAELRIIRKEDGDESQISHPSQFKEDSQLLKIGCISYKGIKVKVSFSGAEGLEGLSHLSGG